MKAIPDTHRNSDCTNIRQRRERRARMNDIEVTHDSLAEETGLDESGFHERIPGDARLDVDF